MAQYSFGSGTLYGRATGNVNATPVQFGTLQDVGIDISFTTKGLFGQYAFARAIGRGQGKITGKASFGQFTAVLFNDLFLNGNTVGGVPGNANAATSLEAGSQRVAQDEPWTIGSGGNHAIVVTPHNGTKFVYDLGVCYAANGVAFTKTGFQNGPGTYNVVEDGTANAGAYNFNSTESGVLVLVNYVWNANAQGITIPMTNQRVGVAPEFLIVFRESFNGKDATIILNSCISSKLSLATKIEDFTIPSFDFEAKADASNNVGSISFDE